MSARTPLAVALAALGLAALAPLSGSSQALAQAPRAPVEVNIASIFGDPQFVTDGYATVVVRVENRTRSVMRGQLVVTSRTDDRAPIRHELRLDLPPRATRSALVDVFASTGNTDLRAVYESGGRAVSGSTQMNGGYAGNAPGVVLLLDPPRVRGNLLDLEVEVTDPSGGTRNARSVVGVVSLDPQSRDPLLPETAQGYGATGLVIASPSMLTRLTPLQRAALLGWIRGGGDLLVFPRTDGELADPNVRSIVGELAREEGSTLPAALVPPRVATSRLRCGEGLGRESFGCSRRLGFGLVYTASYDGNGADVQGAGEVRQLVRSILSRPRAPGLAQPFLPFGRRQEQMNSGYYQPGTASDFSKLRPALDPNESYKPGLGLAAILLLLYVVVVGPLNFRLVQARNRPTLALLTTPLASASFLVLMLGVGYLGKGVSMRYRRVELVEALEGEDAATSRRWTGLFLTRPAVFDLPSEPRGALALLQGGGGAVPPVVEHTGDRTTLRTVRGGLWETLFVREDRVVTLGHGVVFERDGQRLARVVNRTTTPLKGAVIIDGVGAVYVVGDVPAGGRADIPRASSMTMTTTSYYAPDDDPQVLQLGRTVGLAPDEVDVLPGVIAAAGGNLVTAGMPTLLARQVMPRGERIAGTFDPERDVRFLRVVPRVTPDPVRPVSDPSAATREP